MTDKKLASAPVPRPEVLENMSFRKWWTESGQESAHDLTTANAAHAAWQERALRGRRVFIPTPITTDSSGRVPVDGEKTLTAMEVQAIVEKTVNSMRSTLKDFVCEHSYDQSAPGTVQVNYDAEGRVLVDGEPILTAKEADEIAMEKFLHISDTEPGRRRLIESGIAKALAGTSWTFERAEFNRFAPSYGGWHVIVSGRDPIGHRTMHLYDADLPRWIPADHLTQMANVLVGHMRTVYSCARYFYKPRKPKAPAEVVEGKGEPLTAVEVDENFLTLARAL